jgi:hypothetical protein
MTIERGKNTEPKPKIKSYFFLWKSCIYIIRIQFINFIILDICLIYKKIDELRLLFLFTKLTQPSVCLNQGWSNACWAVILSDEFFSNSLFIKS